MPQALDDLEAICLFIARDSPNVARVFARKAFYKTDQLARFPDMGRIVPEWEDRTVREVILFSYRIIYRVLPSEVQILTVHHGARPLVESEGQM